MCACGRDEEHAAQLRARYRHILVDDLQDLSPVHVDIIGRLCSTEGGYALAGDDDETVLGFLGGGLHNFTRAAEMFPDMEIVSLQQCHRSSPVHSMR